MLSETTSGNKLVGMFRGKVLKHLPHGYCKIMVHGVYPQDWEAQPDMLPSAEQASILFGGTNQGNGVFSYPNIGSSVWCWFANGDQNLPVYFASALGGQNAFGQHELVKLSSEEVSQRHLVTSGKTHVEWYENGKLSAIVEDPIRTAASVDFDAQAVTSRELQDKVSSEEISNLNCQLVLDNQHSRGTISCSTHFYNPVSFNQQSSLTSETDITSIIENSSSDERFDSHETVDNLMLHDIAAISSLDSTYSKNTTVAGSTTESTEQIVNARKVQSSNIISTDIDNNFIAEVSHQRKIQDAYTYLENKPTKNTVMTSMTLDDDYTASLVMRDDANAGFEVLSSSTKTIQNNGQMTVIKQEMSNCMQIQAEDGLQVQAEHQLTTDFSGQTTIKKNKIQIAGSNASTAQLDVKMSGYKNSNGTDIVNASFVKKVSTMKGTDEETFQDKLAKVDYSKAISTKDGTDSEVFEDKQRKVLVSNIASTAAGTIEILIQDKSAGKFSKVILDKAGNITLESSTTVILRAPNIEIDGITHITGVTTIDSATTIKSSLTTVGDAEIKGSSYTGHVHQYMVPAHPAGQAPTTTRTS